MGVIPDLASIELINAFGSNYWMQAGSQNWDADIEDDGVQVWWSLLDTRGNNIFTSDIAEDIIVEMNVKFYTATDSFGATKASEIPFFEKELLVAAGQRNDFGLHTSMLIEFDEYVPFIPDDAIIDQNESSARFVVELRLTQSDGSVFADRNGATVAIEAE
jgi:hypothetical protein